MAPVTVSRRSAIAATFGIVASLARAQGDGRPMRLVVPYGAGASIDAITRYFGQKLSSLVGQPVIVDNRPGGSTMIGTMAVVQAAPDGHTLLIGSNTMSIMPHLVKTELVPARDLVAVAPIYTTSIVLVAKPGFPYDSLPQVIAAARREPGKLTFATWGVGSSAHLLMELVKDKAGAYLLHIPYKGGGAEASAAVMAGDVDMGFDTAFTALPRIRNGQLKALAVFDTQRLAALPNVQTVVEAGFPEAALYGWVGLFAPAKSPAPLLQKISAASEQVRKDPAFVEFLERVGTRPYNVTPEVMMEHMKSESGRIQGVVKNRKIELQ